MAAVFDGGYLFTRCAGAQIDEKAFMKLDCKRDGMLISLENHQDAAYLRSLGIKKNGDKLVFEVGFSGDPSEPTEVFLSTEKDYGRQTPKECQDEEI